jgi:WD40 repeat protein
MSENAWVESIVAIVLDNVPVRALCLMVTDYAREFQGVPYQAAQFCTKSDVCPQAMPVSFGDRLVVAVDDTLFVWNVRLDACLLTLRGHTKLVMSIHTNHTQIVSGAGDGTARVWDISTGQCTLVLPHPDWVTSAVLIEPRTIATACYDRSVRIWYDGECIREMNQECFLYVVLLSNKQIAAVPFYGSMYVLGDVSESKIDWSGTRSDTQCAIALQEPVGALAYFNSVHILIWRSRENMIFIPKQCESLCSMERGLLASGGIDGDVCIWNAFTGDLVRTLAGHAAGVYLLAAMPNNKLASASWDKTVRVWDFTTGQCEHVFGTEQDLEYLVALECELVAFDKTGAKFVWV